MRTKHYHILAMLACGLTNFSHLVITAPQIHSFLTALCLGMISIGYLTILIKQRQENHEATSR